jgi:hypothetical protein
MSQKQPDKSKKRTKRSVSPSNIKDELLQLNQPHEFRIKLPSVDSRQLNKSGKSTVTVQKQPTAKKPKGGDLLLLRTIAETATCLWYLKTKFFKREWHNDDNSHEEPSARRALGRINRGIDALKAANIDVQDPVDKRYPPGSESLMKPSDFLPKEGLTYAKVESTVVPIIFFGDQLIQQGEVFVAVPKSGSAPPNIEEQENKEEKVSESITESL